MLDGIPEKKDVLRSKIAAQVEKFLAEGGRISVHDVTESAEVAPPKRMKFTQKSDSDFGFITRPAKVELTTTEMCTMTAIQQKVIGSTEAPRKAVPRSPNLDLSALQIEKGVPVAVQSGGRDSDWVPLLKQMEVGDSVFVEGRTSAQLGYLRKIGARHGINIVTRSVEGGARFWRVADVAAADAVNAEETAHAESDDGL